MIGDTFCCHYLQLISTPGFFVFMQQTECKAHHHQEIT